MSMLCNNDRVCWVIFHLSNCSIQSTFLLFCKILVCVVFAVAKKNTVQKPFTRSLNNNFILESTPSRIFLLSFDFFFFFKLSYSALANCSIPGFIFLLSTREQKCVSTLNFVKNVAIQILGRGPN